MSNDDEALARRAAAVEAEAKAAYGEDAWAGAMRSLTEQVKSGKLEQTDIVRKLNRENAATDLFYQAAGEMLEKDWRAWRDAQPKKRARIDEAKR
jgi:hypothetical protein